MERGRKKSVMVEKEVLLEKFYWRSFTPAFLLRKFYWRSFTGEIFTEEILLEKFYWRNFY